jgi:hypothetical protein
MILACRLLYDDFRRIVSIGNNSGQPTAMKDFRGTVREDLPAWSPHVFRITLLDVSRTHSYC